MTNSCIKPLLHAYLNAKDARTSEEYDESISDLRKIGKQSIKAAILSELIRIHIERPVIIPLTLVACLSSLILFIKR